MRPSSSAYLSLNYVPTEEDCAHKFHFFLQNGNW